jgi:hypothetical protein
VTIPELTLGGGSEEVTTCARIVPSLVLSGSAGSKCEDMTPMHHRLHFPGGVEVW